MRLGGILLVSLALAILTCLNCLWWTPLVLVGYFLGFVLLAAAVLAICCGIVDKDKPQEKDSKFYRRMATLYINALVVLCRVRLHTAGLEKTPKDGRFVLVCNHLSNMDPVVILKLFPKSQLSFISKKENRDMIFVGSVMHKIGCQLINRENDREALKTILKCIQMIKEDQASIAVFPEGYCSLDGKLAHLKGGVFKIAQKTKVPIVVCTIQNTKEALHRLVRLKSSDVTFHLVDVIPPEALEGRNTVDIANQVYEMMLSDLGEEFRREA
jgi:1-acyl-sn-glycerol-3-phosphate acyltransferase